MIRWYVDDDAVERALIDSLHERGQDILAPSDVGLYGAPDGEHLSFAASESRTLISYNRRDFIALHFAWMEQGRQHAGIVLMKQRQMALGERIRRLSVIADLFAENGLTGQLLFIADWG